MPNAASLDADFAPPSSARRKPAGKARAAAGRRKKSGLFSANRMAGYAAVAISATVGIGIVVNALMMQHGHHPAPLFASAKAEVGKSSKALAEPAPGGSAATRPVGAEAARSLRPEAARDPGAAPMARTDTTKIAAAPARSDDAIARLLGGGTPSAAKKNAQDEGKLDGKVAERKTIVAAQQALAKLGFAVKADGVATPATRNAVQAFEKSRHLPVKGELTRHMVHVLAAESGVRND